MCPQVNFYYPLCCNISKVLHVSEFFKYLLPISLRYMFSFSILTILMKEKTKTYKIPLTLPFNNQ